MFILNKTYLETAQTTLAWSLPSVSRTCCLWLLVSLPPSMTFHPQPEVMQPFLVSSDTNFFYHPSTYSNSLEALVSWPNGFSYISSNCLLIYVVYWGHTHLLWWPQNIPYPACNCWQCSISDTIELSQFFLKLPNLLFLFLIYPNILCINPDILQRWCNEPVCRHSWCRCWCWWRCRCCVGFTLFFMSSHHCYWTMQTQSDSGCVDFEKNEELCSLSLVDTAILDQCA